MTKKITDPRLDLLSQINLDTSRIQLDPQLIFLCGGQTDVTILNNQSVRHMFITESMANPNENTALVIAENYKDWHLVYSNLSEFENDLALLSSQIILFLESEGTLAELGFFYANEKIRKKLIIIIHQEFHASNSFIKLGFLNPLEHQNDDSVKVYDIDHRQIDDVDSDEVKDIISDVFEVSDKLEKTEKFDKSNRGHQIFLIFQIIKICKALTISEINEYMAALDIKLSNSALKSALYTLIIFNLVVKTRKSSTNFYSVTDNNNSDRVDLIYSTTARGRTNNSTVKIAISNYYDVAKSEQTNKRRLKVINTSAKKNGVTKDD